MEAVLMGAAVCFGFVLPLGLARGYVAVRNRRRS